MTEDKKKVYDCVRGWTEDAVSQAALHAFPPLTLEQRNRLRVNLDPIIHNAILGAIHELFPETAPKDWDAL